MQENYGRGVSQSQANKVLQEKGNDLLSYATEALSEMKEELTIGIVKIEAIGDPEKQTFSGVMGQTPYFMK